MVIKKFKIKTVRLRSDPHIFEYQVWAKPKGWWFFPTKWHHIVTCLTMKQAEYTVRNYATHPIHESTKFFDAKGFEDISW